MRVMAKRDGIVWSDPKYTGQQLVECTVCERRKHPNGRDPGLEMGNSYCEYECPGRFKEPHAGDLWPGETREDFGHPRELAEEARLLRAKTEEERTNEQLAAERALSEAREAIRKVHRGETEPESELRFEGVRAYTSKRGEK